MNNNDSDRPARKSGELFEGGLKSFGECYFLLQNLSIDNQKIPLKGCPRKVFQNSEKQSSHSKARLTAAQKHAVFKRDHGKCTHVDLSGKRCNKDRWVELHHIRPVSLGGSNDPENLTTLCSYHHDLAHQLSFDIEGQVDWLRSPMAEYGLEKRIPSPA